MCCVRRLPRSHASHAYIATVHIPPLTADTPTPGRLRPSGDEWYNATVYREDWFGSCDNSEADDARLRGRFRDVQLVYDKNSTAFPESNHNPYGFLHENKSLGKEIYLQRTNHVCGFSTIQGFSSCHRMADCFSNYTDLYEWDQVSHEFQNPMIKP